MAAKANRDVSRREELRRSLEERRNELVATLHEKIRGVRDEHATHQIGRGRDDGGASEVDIQEDIELALIQMRFETLGRVDQSLARLEAGVYGQCLSCSEDISTSRLRAMPFAVRCRDCEEQVEIERRRTELARERPFLLDRRGRRDPELG